MIRLSIPLPHVSIWSFHAKSSHVAGSSRAVQAKNSTEQISLSQQLWLDDARCRESRHGISAQVWLLCSGVCAQGSANVHIPACFPFFFFFSWCERGFGAWEGLCLEVCTCGSRTSRVLVSAHDKESSLIKALLNIWEHIFLDMLNCGQTSSTCFAVVSLETSQKWWKFWARVRVCQAFGSGCVNKGTTDFASINSADL